jgi:hypothetical protein
MRLWKKPIKIYFALGLHTYYKKTIKKKSEKTIEFRFFTNTLYQKHQRIKLYYLSN